MDYGDHYWGLDRDYYRDPFPHSLLSTRQITLNPKPDHGPGCGRVAATRLASVVEVSAAARVARSINMAPIPCRLF